MCAKNAYGARWPRWTRMPKGVPVHRQPRSHAHTAWITASRRQQDTLTAQPTYREYRGTVALTNFGPGLIARSVLGARIIR